MGWVFTNLCKTKLDSTELNLLLNLLIFFFYKNFINLMLSWIEFII